jgi:ribosomal protein L11 methyltransferase
MSESWKITVPGPRALIEAALLAHEDVPNWDLEIVIAGSEISEDRPDDWLLEAWLPRRPSRTDKSAIAALFAPEKPKLAVEKLPEADWLVLSQQRLKPVRAGAFLVHTPDHLSSGEAGVRNFVIPASQAFGTGQHQTTAGCLEILSWMKRQGVIVRNFVDVGTGTGLLAFAALHLWPRAIATASDIDPICVQVIAENAAANRVTLGAGAGELVSVIAAGLDNPLLAARAPYDLVIANILAGPLIELAPRFARALVPGGQLLLAGLLTTQEPQIRAACRRAGFRLAARLVKGDWSILWLRRRDTRIRSGRARALPEWAMRR